MLTPEEAKQRLRKAGKTVADVARELNVNHRIVRGVLSGRLQGEYGDAHKVAVTLGLKDGVVIPDGTPLREALKIAGGAR